MATVSVQPASVRRYRIERQLQVRVLGQRKLGRGARQLLGVGAEMLTHPHRNRRLRVLGNERHRPHEILERRPERSQIRKVGHHHAP
jgi:hypothetical protein